MRLQSKGLQQPVCLQEPCNMHANMCDPLLMHCEAMRLLELLLQNWIKFITMRLCLYISHVAQHPVPRGTPEDLFLR